MVLEFMYYGLTPPDGICMGMHNVCVVSNRLTPLCTARTRVVNISSPLRGT